MSDILDEPTKFCHKCNTTKPWSEFYMNRAKGIPYCDCIVCRTIKNTAESLKRQEALKLSKPTNKICETCGQDKDITHFHRRLKCTGGYAYDCKDCVNAKRRKAAEELRESGGYPPVAEKRCGRCKILKPKEQFYLSRTVHTGLSFWCKECHAKNNADKMVRLKSADIIGVKITGMLRNSGLRAKKEGLSFDIDAAYIRSIFPTNCPVLGIPFIFDATASEDASPTLDKFYVDKGYVKGNVTIISNLANKIKTSATTEQVEAVAKWMRSFEDAQASTNGVPGNSVVTSEVILSTTP